MNCLPDGKRRGDEAERITFRYTFMRKYRVFATFLICAAVLIAAFASGGILRSTEQGARFFQWLEQSFGENEERGDNAEETPPNVDQLHANDSHLCNGTPIVSMDLSYSLRGESYLLNETAYLPDTDALLHQSLDGLTAVGTSGEPLVLIVHTHTTESYLPQKQTCIEGDVAESTYSKDSHQNVVAVGRELCSVLEGKGIPTLHCTVDHTANGGLLGAYERSAQSIASYLKQYPSIRLVIDLHRDAVMTSSGEYVQTKVEDEEDLAQIMPVVGTDANGTEHLKWEGNLALALQLRRALNAEGMGVCRPVYLRSSSYNQELAPYSLLVEVGTGANTLEQAKRTARRLGDALYQLFHSS